MVSDTDPKAERVWIGLWRKATPEERLRRTMAFSREIAEISRQNIARERPGWSRQELDLYWVELNYGRDLACKVRQRITGNRV